MQYLEAIDYIHATQKFGSKLGLENIRHLLSLLGDPHKGLKVIHIAGTNGKGSTTSMLASVLQTAGYRVGMYISPYVTCFNERININRENIPDGELAELTGLVKEKVEIMVAEGKNHPTEFEIITAIGFLHFMRQQVDYVVLEVGMGGRLDATNIVEAPLVSVITPISFDHMEYLGDTIEKIAYEKCGIIKQNGTVVCYPDQDKAALAVIKNVCAERNAALTIAPMPQNVRSTISGNTIDYPGFPDIRTSLAGRYQAHNAATVLAALEVLRKKGDIRVSDADIYNGIANTLWAGRFEVIDSDPLVIIDGGHNVSAVQAFQETARELLDGKNIVIVMGMFKDKEYKQCVQLLAPLASRFIATTIHSPRAAMAADIAKYAHAAGEVTVCDDAVAAVNMALAAARGDDVVVVIGSLFLVSEVREYLLKRKD